MNWPHTHRATCIFKLANAKLLQIPHSLCCKSVHNFLRNFVLCAYQYWYLYHMYVTGKKHWATESFCICGKRGQEKTNQYRRFGISRYNRLCRRKEENALRSISMGGHARAKACDSAPGSGQRPAAPPSRLWLRPRTSLAPPLLSRPQVLTQSHRRLRPLMLGVKEI